MWLLSLPTFAQLSFPVVQQSEYRLAEPKEEWKDQYKVELKKMLIESEVTEPVG